MPIWKFQEDSGESGTLELEDSTLDLNAYYQSIDDLLLYLLAHDGVEFEDFKSFLHASAVSLEDLIAYLEAQYQSLEDAHTELSTWGTDYDDLKAWLGAFLRAFEDAKTDFWAAATEYEELQSFLWAVLTVRKDMLAYLHAVGLGLEHMPLYIYVAGYRAADNFATYLAAASSTVLTDLAMHLIASNGLVDDMYVGLCLVAIKEPRGQYIGAYQRTSSVIRVVG